MTTYMPNTSTTPSIDPLKAVPLALPKEDRAIPTQYGQPLLLLSHQLRSPLCAGLFLHRPKLPAPDTFSISSHRRSLVQVRYCDCYSVYAFSYDSTVHMTETRRRRRSFGCNDAHGYIDNDNDDHGADAADDDDEREYAACTSAVLSRHVGTAAITYHHLITVSVQIRRPKKQH